MTVDKAIVHYLPLFDEYLLSKKRANYAIALQEPRGRHAIFQSASFLRRSSAQVKSASSAGEFFQSHWTE